MTVNPLDPRPFSERLQDLTEQYEDNLHYMITCSTFLEYAKNTDEECDRFLDEAPALFVTKHYAEMDTMLSLRLKVAAKAAKFRRETDPDYPFEGAGFSKPLPFALSVILAGLFCLLPVQPAAAQTSYERVEFGEAFTTYHANGQIKAEGRKNSKGQLMGDYSAYSDAGSIKEYGRYIDGKRDGAWSFLGWKRTKDHSFNLTIWYRNGKPHGQITLSTGNKRIFSAVAEYGKPARSKVTTEMGKQWQIYYPDGHLAAHGSSNKNGDFVVTCVYEIAKFDKCIPPYGDTTKILQTVKQYFDAIPK